MIDFDQILRESKLREGRGEDPKKGQRNKSKLKSIIRYLEQVSNTFEHMVDEFADDPWIEAELEKLEPIAEFLRRRSQQMMSSDSIIPMHSPEA
jgi:hypothetical protein